jgi:hypothetical protein
VKRANQLIIAAAIAFVCTAAQAKDNENNGQRCSTSTLHGLYVFHASGFNIVGGVAQPKAIVELINFHGDGNLDVPEATVSINGIVSRSPPGGTGTYTIDQDCTGSLQFHPPGPAFDLVVGFTNFELYMIQTGPGSPVFQGKAERLSP